MEKKFEEKVKSVVKNNFNQSCKFYSFFEDKYNFFYYLTCKLAKFSNIKKDSSVLDAGCGCGYSMKAIYDNFTKDVYGIDISEEMINLGKRLYPKLKFFIGDISNINKIFNNKQFDYVLFNLVVFILPDIENVFKITANILKKNGKVAFSYYPEIVDENNNDLVALAFKRTGLKMPKKRVISEYSRCIDALNIAGFKNIKEDKFEMELSISFLKDFFSIPAQSASLFPKDNYNERKNKINLIFDSIKDFEKKGKIIWKLALGEY